MKRFAACVSAAACCTLFSMSAQAQEVYAKAGFLGKGLGVSFSLIDNFSIRTDVTTVGTIKRSYHIGRMRYDGRIKANQWGLYADWYPFSSGSFHLTGGVHTRNLELSVQGQPTKNNFIIVNNFPIPYTPGDTVTGRVKFPTAAPYLGIGWGLNDTHRSGFGFVFDFGVSFGAPKTDLFVSNSLMNKLRIAAAAGNTTAEESLNIERKKLAEKVSKVRIFPHAYIGMSYRF